jgi:hypothetical protein
MLPVLRRALHLLAVASAHKMFEMSLQLLVCSLSITCCCQAVAKLLEGSCREALQLRTASAHAMLLSCLLLQRWSWGSQAMRT